MQFKIKDVEDDGKVNVVTIDYDGKLDNEESDDSSEGKVEQISIFDDMGD